MAKQPDITREELDELYEKATYRSTGEVSFNYCWDYRYKRSNTDGSLRPKKVYWNGELMPPHQAMYEAHTGEPLADDRWLIGIYNCETPYCGNPNHYREGSYSELMEDKENKRRNY